MYIVIAQKYEIKSGEYYVSVFWGKTVSMGKKGSLHIPWRTLSRDTITKMPLKYEWDGTKKFLFHSMIIIIDCK